MMIMVKIGKTLQGTKICSLLRIDSHQAHANMADHGSLPGEPAGKRKLMYFRLVVKANRCYFII